MFHLVFTICVLFCHTWICVQGQPAELMLPGGSSYEESQGIIEVCAVLNGTDLAVIVNLTTVDGTAQIGVDYDLPTLTITVPANENMGCGNITIIDDSLIEHDETFTVCLDSDCAVVTISDNDGASVSLVIPTSFSVTEEDSDSNSEFCVQLDGIEGGLERNVTLSLSIGGSAGSGDYQINQMLTVPSSTAVGNTVCQPITIVGDDILEGDEIISIAVGVTNPNDVIDGSDIVTVTIEDDDVVGVDLYLPGGQLYSEDVGTFEACVMLDDAVVREIDVTVNLTTVNGTAIASEDYDSVDAAFTFTPNSSNTMCVDITVIDDDFTEAVETLSISLSSDSDSVTFGANPQIFLRDPGPEPIIIGLQQSVYSADESTGVVQVCAVLPAGPAGRPVEAGIVIEAETATDGVDYSPPFFDFMIEIGETVQCRGITIFRDDFVETDESMKVTLVSLDAVTGDFARVTIIDDEGATVSLSASTPTDFTVQPEGDTGNNTDLQFCIQLDDSESRLDRDINLFVVVLNQNIAGAAESGDYQISQILTIPSSTNVGNSVCYNITIIGDNIVEDDETLTFTLRMADSDDTIDGGDIITVTIIDDDGATISLETTSISVAEGNEDSTTSIDISILLLDAMEGLERGVVFLLTTANDTAEFGDYQQLVDQGSIIPPGTLASNSTGNQFRIPNLIIGDDVLEANETFSINISLVNPLDKITGPDSITVTILNEDTSTAFFQLLLTGDIVCKDWVEVNELAKIDTIIARVSIEIEELCSCSFKMDRIEAGQFQCSEEESDVTFRAMITGDLNVLAPELIAFIEEWVDSNVDIEVLETNFTVEGSSTCPVKIDSFDDPLCIEPLTEPPSEGVDRSTSSDDDADIIAGVAVGVFATIIISVIIIAIAIYFSKRQQRKGSWDPSRESHFVMGRPGAEEDPPNNDWTHEDEGTTDPPQPEVGSSLPEYEKLYGPGGTAP